jgi:uncharacterized protein YbcI
MEAIIRDVTGVPVVSLHHDASTITGDEVMVLMLSESPHLRTLKKP